jgi:glycosyltransferase involved in cell wall biosynthesis
MKTVTWVQAHSHAPMGMQHHENELQRALQARAGDAWRFESRHVGSLRTGRGARVRLPLAAVRSAPLTGAAAAGRLAYGRASLVHRFDLRLPPRRGREIVTVHDLPPLRFGDEGDLPRWAAESARRAACVICPSEFAASEVRSLLGVERVHVVANGVGHAFRNGRADGDGLGRFVLHAGGATERKNLTALADAWRAVAAEEEDIQLVLCGPPDARRDRLFADVPRTRFLGLLPPERVSSLMRSAAAVVVPSRYEGFGLPALEGMAAGVPVVAAGAGALPEVCGEAALLVEPTPDGLARGLLAVLRDETLARRLRAEGPRRAAPFTWERAAEETLAIYEDVLA